MTASDDYDPSQFIHSVEWRFAKTMAHYNPHWYVVQRDNRDELFDGFLRYLTDHGKLRSYKGYPYRSVSVDGWDYWTTWASSACYIINRKRSAVAGWTEPPD